MTNIYVDLIKEQIMHNTLGNTRKTLTEITESLLLQHTDDQQEISQAYQTVSHELSGDFI